MGISQTGNCTHSNPLQEHVSGSDGLAVAKQVGNWQLRMGSNGGRKQWDNGDYWIFGISRTFPIIIL